MQGVLPLPRSAGLPYHACYPAASLGYTFRRRRTSIGQWLCVLFLHECPVALYIVLPGQCPQPALSARHILQHNFIQDTLPYVVGCADLSAFFLVGAAGEVVVGGGQCVCPMQDHRGAAVGAHHHARILVEFLHLCEAISVLSYQLDDIPNLLRDQRRMSSLKHQALFPGMLYIPFVFIGFCGELHVDCVPKVSCRLPVVVLSTVTLCCGSSPLSCAQLHPDMRQENDGGWEIIPAAAFAVQFVQARSVGNCMEILIVGRARYSRGGIA